MKQFIPVLACCILATASLAQNTSQKIKKAYLQFEADPQLKNAISSLFIIDAKTGEIVFEKNSTIGLAPASTQKIITAATAFELLGRDYRYRTGFFYTGTVNGRVLTGGLLVKGGSDPTLGSWRYTATKPENIQAELTNALHKQNIYSFTGNLTGIIGPASEHTIPDGWIWQDIGNYYGAASSVLNWNENQYDLVLKPGRKEGDTVHIIRTQPVIMNEIINELRTGPKKSGDNGYIYFEPGTDACYIKGTVPCCVDSFVISGAVTGTNLFTLDRLADLLFENKFKTDNGPYHQAVTANFPDHELPVPFLTHYSPSLDSIVYWLLKKSINLYGEALINTIGFEKGKSAISTNAIQVVKDCWKQKGIDPRELNIYDGSGLSPLNRITTHAQVEILKYARRQAWFPGFYDALPVYNSMKLKSGTISDVKGFCGYHTAQNGNEYIISFLVNNYNGESSALVNKMYRVLDILK